MAMFPFKKSTKGFESFAGKLDKRTWLILGALNFALLGAALYVYLALKQRYPALGLILILGVLDGITFIQFRKALHSDESQFQSEFTRIFAYFAIYIRDGLPVYHALEECVRYASPAMERQLRALLEGIDSDKSVAPYITFGDSFHSMEIRQLLISIYRMVDEGGGESYIRQFNVLFESLQANQAKTELERTDSRLGSAAILPMADSALVMLLITIGIIQIIGGYVDGI
ncbi:MAG: hypothetical protein WCS90_02010 [Bacilli bacterium]